MSFSAQTKLEIYKNSPKSVALKKAQCLGLMYFGKQFGAEAMEFVAEQRTPARLYSEYISGLIGHSGSITMKESKRKNGKLYTVTVDSAEDCAHIMRFFAQELDELTGYPPEKMAAFLAGAFLSCGSVTDPQKDYHLEFVPPNPDTVERLEQVLTAVVGAPKRTTRRQNTLLYYKESENVEDVLTACGAVNASLAIMETKIVKEVRNKANRVTNCETANIEKTVNAAVEQCEKIEYLYAHMLESAIPEELLEIARVRLDNPEMSLRELGEQLAVPLSRSGVHHRLKKLCDMADEMRK